MRTSQRTKFSKPGCDSVTHIKVIIVRVTASRRTHTKCHLYVTNIVPLCWAVILD